MFAVIFLLLLCMAGNAAAADADISTGDIVITESGYTVGGGGETKWEGEDHALSITGVTTTNNITVINGSCTLTLSVVTITPTGRPALSVYANESGTGAQVTLVVSGENTLAGGEGCAAIEVKAGWDGDDWSEVQSGSLVIQGDGNLTVTGGKGSSTVGGGAGIGGNGFGLDSYTDGGDFGSIQLAEAFAGKIAATGGNATSSKYGSGAGIGGGGTMENSWDWTYAGSITICNGTLTASGGNGGTSYISGAGIGTGAPGQNAGCGNSIAIAISGGTVTATGGMRAAGIGGGENAAGGCITISGGTVTATGEGDGEGFGGAGIGGGDNGEWSEIIIGGDANVTAYGDDRAAGIGGRWVLNGVYQNITIKDSATVFAQGGWKYGPGIGAGSANNPNDPLLYINITSTKPVIAVTGDGKEEDNKLSRAIGAYSSGSFIPVYLTIGPEAQVWAFNREIVNSALDWENVTCQPGAIAVAYNHPQTAGTVFPEKATLSDLTHSKPSGVDISNWKWKHYNDGNPGENTVRIEILPEEGAEAIASHTAFHDGNWAYAGAGGTPATCTVIFETNGGTAIASQTIPSGTPVQEPEVPVREGYIFAGWYSDTSYTTPWNFGTAVKENTILYAKWEEHEVPDTPGTIPSGDGNMNNAYRVLFLDGSATYAIVTGLSSGDRVEKPVDPVKDDHTFAGWYLDTAGTRPWDFTEGIPGDLTLYAVWTPKATPVPTVTETVSPTASPTAELTQKQPVQPTEEATGKPAEQSTGNTQLDENAPDQSTRSALYLIGGIVVVFLFLFFLLLFLFRHTVTFLIPAEGEIQEYRIKVWHGCLVDSDTLPELLRTAAWYRDPERHNRWNFDEDRVKKSIELYLG